MYIMKKVERKFDVNSLRKINNLQLGGSTLKTKNNENGIKAWSTTIQILLPVAVLAVLWGRRGFFARFFLQFDKNCVSVFCPSFSKRQRLLKWASGRLQPTWSFHTSHQLRGLAEFWRDGSLLCTLVNSAIPGACPNPHRHWQKPPSHGQALAYKYLGVIPLFAESELIERYFTAQQERALLNYLMQIQQAITRISEKDFKFSSKYVARGMGLVTGEQDRKTSFYIYSNNSTNKHDVIVSIRGPYNSHSVKIIPTSCIYRKSNQQSLNERRRLAYESKASRFFFRSLSIDFGSFINLSPKDHTNNDIPIKLFTDKDRIKLTFIPKYSGIHEISIITNGSHLLGSPFTTYITANTTGIAENFEERDISLYNSRKLKSIRRKIISKIIDFVDEQISYEKLKTTPLHNREVPEITITQSDEVNTQEVQSSLVNGESLNTTKLEPATSIPNKNVTDGNFSNDADEFFSTFLKPDTQSNPSNTIEGDSTKISNIILDENDNIFQNDGQKLTVIPSTTAENISEGNEVDFLIANIVTSPVCAEHIEFEVKEASTNCNETSTIPKRNYKSKYLQKQDNLEISDNMLKKEIRMKENLLPAVSLGSFSELESLSEYENLIKDFNIKETNVFSNKTLQSSLERIEEQNRNIDEEFERLFESQWLHDVDVDQSSDHCSHEIQENHGQTLNTLNEKGSRCLEASRMNILNYLSSLKQKHPNNSVNTAIHASYFSKSEQCDLNEVNVKNCLEYWENRRHSNAPKDQHPFRFRRSLPNLLSEQLSTRLFHASQTEFNKNQLKNQEALKFRSLFDERRNFWRVLSLKTLSSSTINSSFTHLDIIRNTKKNKFKTRRSLPDLFSQTFKEEIYNRIRYENPNFPLDFFKSPEMLEFKIRFKECKDYWERLSSQNFTRSTYHIENMNFEETFDSGFYNSLPNLSVKHSNEDLNKFSKDQYKERQEYWEQLSSSKENQISLEESQWNSKLMYGTETLKSRFKNSRSNEFCNMEHSDPETNLTDDLKHINDRQNKINVQFYEARNFFKALEDSTKLK